MTNKLIEIAQRLEGYTHDMHFEIIEYKKGAMNTFNMTVQAIKDEGEITPEERYRELSEICSRLKGWKDDDMYLVTGAAITENETWELTVVYVKKENHVE